MIAAHEMGNLRYYLKLFGIKEMPSFVGSGDLSLSIVGVLNAGQIWLTNLIYRPIAQSLTIWENHRTDKEFINAYCRKTVGFQLINSYASLIYYAFGKEVLENHRTDKEFINAYCRK